MNKESFRILKEINSLNARIRVCEQEITEELSRITKIEKQRSHRNDDLLGFMTTHKKEKNELAHHEDKISYFTRIFESAKTNEANVFTEQEISTLSKQIKSSSKSISEHEDSALELIEIIESIEVDISNANSFLSGSLEAITEIEQEINQNNAGVYKEIQTSKTRILLLHGQLPESVVVKLNNLIALKLKHGPLAEISAQNTCVPCGYLIHNSLVSNIETHQKFHTCPGCRRILIPQSSKF